MRNRWQLLEKTTDRPFELSRLLHGYLHGSHVFTLDFLNSFVSVGSSDVIVGFERLDLHTRHPMDSGMHMPWILCSMIEAAGMFILSNLLARWLYRMSAL